MIKTKKFIKSFNQKNQSSDNVKKLFQNCISQPDEE